MPTPDTATAYRWQTTAHRVLGELITGGQKAGLPPLTWILATSGALTGQVDVLAKTSDEQRAGFTAWARHLDATVTETPRADGRISLHAFINHDGERVGVLRAELFPGGDAGDSGAVGS